MKKEWNETNTMKHNEIEIYTFSFRKQIKDK